MKIVGMDGRMIASQIKSVVPEARIVVLTNHYDEDLDEQARLPGASKHVCKEDLIEVRRTLSAV